MADTNRGIWTCKIGEVDRAKLPSGSDNYMRDALVDVYESLVGERPTFIFSGWGGELTEPERAVVEDREPAPPMADTLKELMTDEARELREPVTMWIDARNALRAELRPGIRALRKSHDALRDSLQELAEGPWHNSKCAGWSEDEGETEYDMRTVMRPELCDCAISRARAALAKAEALHG